MVKGADVVMLEVSVLVINRRKVVFQKKCSESHPSRCVRRCSALSLRRRQRAYSVLQGGFITSQA